MLDRPSMVAPLLEQLQYQLPIPAFPTKELVRILRRGGVKTSTERALSITRVFYAGDEGGIVCDVTPRHGAKEVFIVSLTHLRIAPHHPLFPSIVAYQRERVRRLAVADV
ncbi:MAG TPA: hypothetical protein VGJ60_13250 [Chloroflexota bacterium]|jgi:hypothetical protein